jgi:hypothetical protein
MGQTGNAKNKYPDPPIATKKTVYPMKLTEAEWKERLTPEQYFILRQEGTERAGTGKYDHFYEKGTYYSAASLQPLFSSKQNLIRNRLAEFLCTHKPGCGQVNKR